jgi:hypothetical protein
MRPLIIMMNALDAKARIGSDMLLTFLDEDF